MSGQCKDARGFLFQHLYVRLYACLSLYRRVCVCLDVRVCLYVYVCVSARKHVFTPVSG